MVLVSCMCTVLHKIVEVCCDEPTAACMQEKHTSKYQGKRNCGRSVIRGSCAFLNSSNIAACRYCHLLHTLAVFGLWYGSTLIQ
jgi:hypothetical protein